MGEEIEPPVDQSYPGELLVQSDVLIETGKQRIRTAKLVLLMTFVPALASGMTLFLSRPGIDPIIQYSLVAAFCGLPAVGGITTLVLVRQSAEFGRKADQLSKQVGFHISAMRWRAGNLRGLPPPSERLN